MNEESYEIVYFDIKAKDKNTGKEFFHKKISEQMFKWIKDNKNLSIEIVKKYKE